MNDALSQAMEHVLDGLSPEDCENFAYYLHKLEVAIADNEPSYASLTISKMQHIALYYNVEHRFDEPVEA